MATIVKTKDLMIEVARQLFARVGFTNTTMNDIADASKKGRRTLYTYFRNKDEIFHAVIERELERLWHDLELIRRLPASPEDKILTMLLTHLDKMKDLVLRNGSLRAEFFRDIWLVENSRAAFDEKEIRQLRELLEEGKIGYDRPNRHRYVLLRDLEEYSRKQHEIAADALDSMIREADEAGLYDIEPKIFDEALAEVREGK